MIRNLFLILLFNLSTVYAELNGGKVYGSGDEHSGNSEIILARVAGKEITYKDFIERAEYTLRPVYCKGSSNNDKNIILNTLIAEKLISLEKGSRSEVLQNENFVNTVIGRKEQKMREVLYYEEGISKVKLDNKEVQKIFDIAGRTYKIQYYNISDKNLAGTIKNKFDGIEDSADFNSLFAFLNQEQKLDSIPEKEISWNSPEVPVIHNALFSDKLKRNQVLGPIEIDDSTNVIIRVKGWTDEVAVSEAEIKLRWSDVCEKLTSIKADSIYDVFIIKLMENKKLQLNPDTFNSLVKIFAPFYTNIKKSSFENEFLKHVYRQEVELKASPELGKSYDEIRDKILLTIDEEKWTVNDLKEQIERHPLVFRKENYNDNFSNQLKLAIVDLVRDKYLTAEAYKRELNKSSRVKHYEQTWLDAGIALHERDKFLGVTDTTTSLSTSVITEKLNPYIKELLKKYSDQMEINVENYNKINLTRIDLYAVQPEVPYTIYVPPFPQLTTYNRLDYGKRLITEQNN